MGVHGCNISVTIRLAIVINLKLIIIAKQNCEFKDKVELLYSGRDTSW